MENDRLVEVERRLAVLEGMLKVKKLKECKVCGFDMNRPWACETKGCPKMVVLGS